MRCLIFFFLCSVSIAKVGVINNSTFKPVEWLTYKQIDLFQTTDENQSILISTSISDGQLFNVKISCNAKLSDGSKRSTFIKSATIYGSGGLANIEGNIVSSFDQPGTTYNMTMDVVGSSWRVLVTGASGETVDWQCVCEQQEFGI